MSTSWNARCPVHPDQGPLLDEDWQGSGDYAGRQLSALWAKRYDLLELGAAAGRLREDADVTIEWGHFRRLDVPTMTWLRQHAECPVELVDEYGAIHAAGSFKPLPPHHCTSCACRPGQGKYETAQQFAERDVRPLKSQQELNRLTSEARAAGRRPPNQFHYWAHRYPDHGYNPPVEE